ncbi:hypothetical protein GCM10027317_44470 [Massilia agri]
MQESITKNVPGKAWPAALNRSDTAWYREDLQRSRVHFLVVEAAAMNRSVLPQGLENPADQITSGAAAGDGAWSAGTAGGVIMWPSLACLVFR